MAGHNLPQQPTPFVGRTTELTEITGLLADPACRLLTLVGPGGVGKTRLALQTAAMVFNRAEVGGRDSFNRSEEPFSDGVYFVALQPLTSPDFILSALAEAIGVRFYPGDEPLLQLIDYLCFKTSLLIFDNFEHLLDGVGLVSTLLRSVPNLKILVTTRETLNLQEEWLHPVQGMRFPEDGHDGHLEGYSAVQLFLQSAQRSRPNFSLAANQHEVIRICQLVEGMPLALEMTAAWLKRLPCPEIVVQLEHGLDILENPARNVPARHRSMRAAFEGSWNFLTDAERSVFMKLSVFRGGFRKEAAQAVAGASLGILSALIDKSLLRIDNSGRYDVHELLRQYAEEQLEALPGANRQAQASHSAYYVNFLEQREIPIINQVSIDAAMEISAELKNVESAWEWAMEQRLFDKFFTAGRCLLIFYQNRCWSRQAEAFFGKTLAILRNDPPSIVLAAVIMGQGWCVQTGSYQFDKARALLEEGLSISRQFKSALLIHFALQRLSELAVQTGNYEEAKRLAEEDLLTLRQGELRWQQTYTLSHLGKIALLFGDYPEAKRLLQQAIDVAQTYDVPTGLADARNTMGQVELALHAYQVAAQTFAENLIHQKKIDHREGELGSLIGLGEAARGLGAFTESRRYFAEALQMAVELHDIPIALDALTATAELLIQERHSETALQLLALVLNHRVTTHETKKRAQQLVSELESQFSPQAVAGALQEGKTQQVEVVIEALLDNQLSVQPKLEPESYAATQFAADLLTERELEIVRLIAAGLSNDDIARHLFIGVSTVKKHINHLYDKLDVSSRTQALIRARELNLL